MLITVLVGIAVWLLAPGLDRIKAPEPLDAHVNPVSMWLLWIGMFAGLGGTGLLAGWAFVSFPSWTEGPDAEVQPALAWLWILGSGLVLLAVVLVVLASVLGRLLPKTDGPAYPVPAHTGVYAVAGMVTMDAGLLVAAGAAPESDCQAVPVMMAVVFTVVLPFVLKDSW